MIQPWFSEFDNWKNFFPYFFKNFIDSDFLELIIGHFRRLVLFWRAAHPANAGIRLAGTRRVFRTAWKAY